MIDARAGLLACVALLSSRAAWAEIKDYEVLRLLYLHTPCGMASIAWRQTSEHEVRLHADCQNRTAFPDGAEVVCTDHHDDRSCRVRTPSRAFDSLELLRPSK